MKLRFAWREEWFALPQRLVRWCYLPSSEPFLLSFSFSFPLFLFCCFTLLPAKGAQDMCDFKGIRWMEIEIEIEIETEMKIETGLEMEMELQMGLEREMEMKMEWGWDVIGERESVDT